MTKYLFSSSGQWIAFKRDIATAKRILTFYRSQKLRICFAVAISMYLTLKATGLAGPPWRDGDVFDPNGEYLGTITQNNRLYRFSDRPYRGYPGYPGYPGYARYSPLPPFAEDIEDLEAV